MAKCNQLTTLPFKGLNIAEFSDAVCHCSLFNCDVSYQNRNVTVSASELNIDARMLYRVLTQVCCLLWRMTSFLNPTHLPFNRTGDVSAGAQIFIY